MIEKILARKHKLFSALLVALMLTACGNEAEKTATVSDLIVSPAMTPSSPVLPSRTAAKTSAPPTMTPSPTLTPPAATATSSPSPTPNPGINGLPRSLYFLNPRYGSPERGVWRLDPGAAQATRITPPEMQVTSFDIWSGDGRLAYGTNAGKLYVALPQQQPQLFYDASLETDYPLSIASLAWSPDGTRLAYVVHNSEWGIDDDSAEDVGRFAGLWLLNLEKVQRSRLLAHQYPHVDGSEFPNGHIFTDPLWSPDGTALILRVSYWEGSDIVWLAPIIPDSAKLYDYPDESRLQGAWTRDGQSILLSGAPYSNINNLDIANRATMSSTRLIDGASESLHVRNAQELPSGIAFVAMSDATFEPSLYLGSRTESGFVYAPTGSGQPLCSKYIDIAWDQSGDAAVVSCYEELRLISLDGTLDVDLAPFLGSLVGQQALDVFWGPASAPEPTVARTPTETPVLAEAESRTWSSTSPDGEWSAQGLAAFPDPKMGYYTRLEVVKADGTLQWTVVDEWLSVGLGYTVPQPFYWSPDGRYFYFTNYPAVDGCAVFVNGTDLHRVDLADGSVAELAPSLGLWLSLSPDETTLAYVGYGERGLVLRDLGTGAEREIELDPGQDYTAGHIVWSPDGAALMLTLALKPCSTNWSAAVAVLRVEVETLETRTLIQEDERLFVTAQWPEPGKVLLQDKAGNSWWMDANTGQVGE